MTFRRAVITSTLLSIGLTVTTAANASQREFGWLEQVMIETWGVTVNAKLDTGALTSSMQAEDIETFEENGEPWVKFVVAITDEATDDVVAQTFRRPIYRRVKLRGAGGTDERHTVLMNLCIRTKIYQTQVTLENRDGMNYPVLLGRRILQALGPVDVTQTYLHEPTCDDDSPVVKLNERRSDEDIGL